MGVRFTNETTFPIEEFTVEISYRDYDITPDGEQFLMAFAADRTEVIAPARPQINIVLNCYENMG